MTAREHALIIVAAIFTAEHNSRRNEDIFNIIDRALTTAEVYLSYCEKKMGVTFDD